MDLILHWLLPAVGGALVGSAAPWPAKALWAWIRGSVDREERKVAAEVARLHSELERLAGMLADRNELVDLLRKGLDKHLIREAAVASACELLIALVHMVEKPTPAMLRMRDRALEVLEDARAHIIGINRGGNA